MKVIFRSPFYDEAIGGRFAAGDVHEIPDSYANKLPKRTTVVEPPSAAVPSARAKAAVAPKE